MTCKNQEKLIPKYLHKRALFFHKEAPHLPQKSLMLTYVCWRCVSKRTVFQSPSDDLKCRDVCVCVCAFVFVRVCVWVYGAVVWSGVPGVFECGRILKLPLRRFICRGVRVYVRETVRQIKRKCVCLCLYAYTFFSYIQTRMTHIRRTWQQSIANSWNLPSLSLALKCSLSLDLALSHFTLTLSRADVFWKYTLIKKCTCPIILSFSRLRAEMYVSHMNFTSSIAFSCEVHVRDTDVFWKYTLIRKCICPIIEKYKLQFLFQKHTFLPIPSDSDHILKSVCSELSF